MARSPRIEYPGAIYHVINRGNYRSDVFGSPGAAQAFVAVLEEAVPRFGWELGAYVVMRNHFHLALRTPEPNLAAGMQWLQVTFATRFNRLRGENGHLFQGRYKALVLENEGVWSRVVDYIHLNPLRARIVEPEQLAQFRWSSLSRFVQGKRFEGLNAAAWLKTLGLEDEPDGWREYGLHPMSRYAASDEGAKAETMEYSRGWAVGSPDWKTEVARTHRLHDPLAKKAEYLAPKEAQVLRWEEGLNRILSEAGSMQSQLTVEGRMPLWKVRAAARVQSEFGASVVWLAQALKIARPGTLRTALWRMRQKRDM